MYNILRKTKFYNDRFIILYVKSIDNKSIAQVMYEVCSNRLGLLCLFEFIIDPKLAYISVFEFIIDPKLAYISVYLNLL